MMRSTQTSLLADQMPTRELIEIGLRSSIALAQAGCETGDRLGRLQLGAMRSAVEGCNLATRQILSAEPTGQADPTTEAMQKAMSYWRSLAGIVATSQAEMAELMDSGLKEMAGLAENALGRSGPSGAASLPVALCAAAGASMLATTQALCGRIGETARQFASSNGVKIEPAAFMGEEEDAGQARARSQRKAA